MTDEAIHIQEYIGVANHALVSRPNFFFFLTKLNLSRVVSLVCLYVLSGVNRCLSPTVIEKDLSLYSKSISGNNSVHGPSEIVTEPH